MDRFQTILSFIIFIFNAWYILKNLRTFQITNFIIFTTVNFLIILILFFTPHIFNFKINNILVLSIICICLFYSTSRLINVTSFLLFFT
jgi:hypothetical protein